MTIGTSQSMRIPSRTSLVKSLMAAPSGRRLSKGASLPIIQPGLGEPRLEDLPRHEGDEGPGRLGDGAAGGQASRVRGDLLQIFRLRSDQGHALDGQDLANLMSDQL